ncbi:hypothetical protein [Candidatus Nanosyncoccus nanoralicus]|uniref:Uncharacterized protein n=1 Tax=Candidatus Nanosyncoccus nanoralicus TaxID=2171996 RepID=A0ABY0FM41_9BACT|nr:hypothetical protein [Candidatus Nanosyncoccus nanoralicus]RYC73891.1 hypothetical protein G3KMM_00116 [Candidatus Nanosyncoccus nanoralicus]
MIEKKLLELEDFLLEFYGEENIELVISEAASILGVLIGIKPAALLVNDVMEDGRMLLDGGTLKNILEELGIKITIGNVSKFAVHKNNKRMADSLYEGDEFIYISIDDSLCDQLKKNYLVVTDLTEDGVVAEKDRNEWNEANLRVGKLLGYPETAVLEYIKTSGDVSYMKSEKRRKRMARNRYYAHSEKFEDDEFRKYDLPLNQAILKYLPRIAKSMQADLKKRWLD